MYLSNQCFRILVKHSEEEVRMMKFIEPFIDVKLQLAQYLYINHGQLDQKRLCEELEISPSTFKRTLAEVEELYKEFYYNGSFYNSHSLVRIVKRYVNDSSRLSLLKLLILYPGEGADFYKQHLLLSDATFSRTIQQLKKILVPYNIQIKVSSGYWINANNKIEWVMFATHVASTYFWDQNELRQIIINYGGESFLENESAAELERFSFADHPLVHIFYTNIYYFSLIYQYQKNQGGKQEVTIDHTVALVQLKKATEEVHKKYHARIAHTIHTVLYELLDPIKRERLIDLLLAVAFQWELFPYDVDLVDLRQDYFVRKMIYLHPKREQILTEFINRMTHLVHVPFTGRRTSLMYLLIFENIFTFEKREAFTVFVYSSLGKNHRSFLLEHLEPLRNFYPEPFQIVEIQKPEEILSDKQAIVLTNQAFDTISSDNQYIVSDYLTMRDFLQFSIWLKDRTSHSLDNVL